MFAKTLISLVLITSLLVSFPQRIVSQEITIQEKSIQEQVEYFSNLNGVDPKLISKIIQCESQGNENAKGDSGRAFGLLQYHKQSFENHAQLFGEKLDYYSSFDQIKLASWAIANGRGNEWTAYRSIMNGGTYSFYSKLLKKHFVVKCK